MHAVALIVWLAAAGPPVALDGGGAASDTRAERVAQSIPTIRPIEVGTRRRGRLEAGDRQLQTGEYVDYYGFNALAGQRLRVELSSPDFDTYLTVTGAGGFYAANDDAEQGVLDSLLEIEIDEDGQYVVAVSSYRPDETGEYTVNIEPTGPAILTEAQAAGRIELGQTIEARLDRRARNRVDAYRFEVPTRMTIRLAARSSEIDPVVRLIGPGGYTATVDDTPGAGADAIFRGELPVHGEYVIEVEGYAEGEDGTYQLSLADDLRPETAVTRTLGSDERVEGTLADGDRTTADGAWLDLYRYRTSAGQQLRVTLESTDFDPFLFMRGPGANTVDCDDRSDLDPSAAIITTTLASGSVLVGVTSAAAGHGGDYVLRFEAAPSPAVRLEDTGEGLAAEGEITLDTPQTPEARPYVSYLIEAGEGDWLEAGVGSTAFDPALELRFPDGERRVSRDEAPGDIGARWAGRLPRSGLYEVRVLSQYRGRYGPFELTGRLVPAATLEAERRAQHLEVGRPVRGRLSRRDDRTADGRRTDRYRLQTESGQRYRVTVASERFQPELRVIGPNGFGEDAVGNWGWGTGDIVYRLTAATDGLYDLEVTSRAGGTGRYRLELAFDPPAAGDTPQSPAAEEAEQRPANARHVNGVFAGITGYPGRGDAPNSRRDARKLVDRLTGAGVLADSARLLVDQEVTRDGLRQAIAQAAAGGGPGDVFVFFFSGRAVARADGFSMEADHSEEILLLWDGEVMDDELARWLGEIEARLVVVVIDAPHSGGLANDLIIAPDRVGIFTSEEDILSVVAERFRPGGLLPPLLAEALTGGADDHPDDDLLTVGELAGFLESAWPERLGGADDESELVRTRQRLVVSQGAVSAGTVVLDTSPLAPPAENAEQD